jgi:hypothetical protein
LLGALFLPIAAVLLLCLLARLAMPCTDIKNVPEYQKTTNKTILLRM